MVLIPSRTRRPSRWNSGPRWSMVGMSIARRTRSGTGVGPGIWRKWRPAVRAEFFGMGVSRDRPPESETANRPSRSLVVIKDECDIQSSLWEADPAAQQGLSSPAQAGDPVSTERELGHDGAPTAGAVV